MLTINILFFESLPSTNIEAARRAAEGAPEGLCIIASEQTAGRGRLERTWVSPQGAGLYFSMILRPAFGQSLWPLLTMMAAIALSDTLRDAFNVVVDIKWPNDLLVDGKKLSGILAETVDTPVGRAVVLGIGVNIKRGAFPAEIEKVATSLEALLGVEPEPQSVVGPLVKSLVTYYEILQSPHGPETIVQEWCNRSSYAIGKRIRVTNGHQTIEGTSCGLAADGGLRIKDSSGQIQTVRAGDVTVVSSPAVPSSKNI